MNTFSYVFLAFLALSIGLRVWLARRQIRHVRIYRDSVPDEFQSHITLDDHRKAADYTNAKTRLSLLDMAIGTAVLLGWTFGGGLELLDRTWRSLGLNPVLTGTGVIVSLFVISAIIELPLSLYRTFVLEERFGFNRMTPGLFIADLIKGFLLLLLLGAPLAAAALWFMYRTGGLWWLWVWTLWMAFSLLLTWAYPAVIAPLFNKFTTLENESLKSRIENLLERCGFRSKGIYVMDGSKRSAHGNAYFTGIGNNKRIVFFDTLMESLEPGEIEAVLAHELGHFRKRHIIKRLALGAITSLAALALLGWLSTQPWFYSGLGVNAPSPHMALLLFLLAGPAFTALLSPLAAAWSRKHEFEADEYAAGQSDARALINALIKLYRENASTLTPDPLYSAFYYSHPPAMERISQLKQMPQHAV